MFYRNKYSISKFLIALVFIVFDISPASSSPNIVYSTSNLGTTCLNSFTLLASNSNNWANRFYVGQTGVLSRIREIIPAGATTAMFNNTQLQIRADSAGNVGSVLATYSATSIDTVSATNTIDFTGTYSVTAGTYIWLFVNNVNWAQNATGWCYYNGSGTGLGFGSWVRSNTGSAGYSDWANTINNGSTFAAKQNLTDDQLWTIYQDTATAVPDTTTISIAGNLNAVTYRQSIIITANVASDGKVTFYQNNKRIFGCINITSQSLIATCNWRPLLHNTVLLTASTVPISSSFSTGYSSPLNVTVYKRSNSR